MGGHLRLVVITASALATFAFAAPLTVSAAPSAAHHGERAIPAQIERSKPRAGQPAERADHASSQSQGRHDGAGNDSEQARATAATSAGAAAEISSPSPSASAEAASTALTARGSESHPATSTPPTVIVEAPEAPQPNPPVAAPQVLTAARLDWILVGVVVALAASVAAAVRVATFRGRRPQR